MAWTAPKTWTDGAVSAAEFNSELRDNLVWLKAALTTIGATSDSVVQSLLSARYGCSALVESFTCNDATDQSIPFAESDEEWDNPAFHSDTYPSRFIAPAAGTYELKLWVQFATNTSGFRSAWFEVNGTDEYNRVRTQGNASSVTTNIYTSVEVELAADDYVVCRARQNSGSSLDCKARFSIRRIAA